ncbi:MAG: prepilin peptidase [Pseudomonadota bacterium]
MQAAVPVLFFLAALPLCLYGAWTDLSRMRLSNKLNLTLFAVFLVLGLLLLPFESYLWRMAAAAIAFAVGFFINALGLVGGGDAKFCAAGIPWIATEHLSPFIMVFFTMMLAAFITHRMFRAIPSVRRATGDWVSWDAGRKFPMGMALSGSLLFYLACVAFFRFPVLAY